MSWLFQLEKRNMRLQQKIQFEKTSTFSYRLQNHLDS